MEEFDFLVIGNEPTGLWLLRRLHEELSPLGGPPRLGWVDLGPLAETFFPEKLAEHFRLSPASAVFSPELVSPERTLTWREETLSEVFPELPSTLLGAVPTKNPLALTAAEKSSLRYALRTRPELLPLSQGLWKRLGRAQALHPETILAASLYCTRLREWNPAQELPPSIETFRLSPEANPLQGMKASRAGDLSLQFQGLPPLLAHKWILNLSFHVLERIARETPEFLALLHGASGMRSHRGLFGLDVQTKASAIPSRLSPVTVVLETETIPDPEEEIWPLQIGPEAAETRSFTLWASAPQEVSLEATLDQFRRGMGRLHGLFPFLSDSVISYSLPLGMESCFDDDARNAAIDRLYARHSENYQAVSFQIQTRSPALDTFFPYLHCHLPYPVGPLCAAQGWLDELVRRRKRKYKPPAAPAPEKTVNS